MKPFSWFLCLLFNFLSLITIARGHFDGDVKDVRVGSVTRVVVTRIDAGGEAEQIGQKIGDTILVFDDIPVTSRDEFLKQVAAVDDAIPVRIKINRNGKLLIGYIQLMPFRMVQVRVHRESDFWGYGTDYQIFADGRHIGDIGGDETRWVSVPDPPSHMGKIFFKIPGLVWDHTSDTLVYRIKPNRILILSFKGSTGRIQIDTSYELTRSKLDSLHDYNLDVQEGKFYDYLTSKASLAPQFFKNSVRPSLSGELSFDGRESFYAPFVQCRAIFRLLTLVILLGFLCGLLKKRLFWFVPGYILLSYFISWVLGSTVNTIIFDGVKYMPFQFIFFCFLALLVVGIITYTFTPLYKLLTRQTDNWKKAIGFAGTAIGIIGTASTLKDIYGWVVDHLK